MINTRFAISSLDDLILDSEIHMGWVLTGQAQLMPFRSFTCYAWPPDEGPGFSVQVIGNRSAGETGAREQAKTAAIAIAKAKIFLGTWRPNSDYSHSLEDGDPRPGSMLGIRERLLHGFHRLWQDGVEPESIQVDLDGIALELGVTRGQIDRTMELLMDLGAIADAFSDDDMAASIADTGWSDGRCWLTSAGVLLVETSSQPANDYFSGAARQLATDLAVLDPTLGARLDEAVSAASVSKGSRGDRVAYGNRIRDLILDVTDKMVRRVAPGGEFARNETKNKVREICRIASSKTSAEQTKALAEVTEVHWTRMNEVVQGASHNRPISEHRLLIYAVMFLGDLWDVYASGQSPAIK